MTHGRKDPAFLFYAADWLLSEEVTSMTLEQQGAYMRLLCFAWLHGSIPATHATLQGLLGLSKDEEGFARLWAVVSRCWVEMPGTPGRLINQRQEHERAERKRRSAEMAERGQAGGMARAKHEAGKGQAEAKQESSRPPSRGQAEAKPSTSTSTVPNPSSFLPSRATVPKPPPDPAKEGRKEAIDDLVESLSQSQRGRP